MFFQFSSLLAEIFLFRNAVLGLVGCLQIFVTASTSGVLGPVLTFVNGSLTLLLSICAGATVLVGVSN